MLDVHIGGVAELEQSLSGLASGSAMNRVLAPSLLAQARVARDFARRPNRARGGDDFRDRTPSERALAGFPKAKGLRKSIRASGALAYYAGIRYRRGRATVSAGGPGARQAFLVHEGHAGPRPARPYRFLRRAIYETESAGIRAFSTTAREKYVKVVGSIRQSRRGNISVIARTISRRKR